MSVDAVAKSGSIRKAAEILAIDSTALNRRILAIERELGFDIFERIPRGVRLTTAGEILVHHIRTQSSDFERVKSQIADLSGERRGHVSIACSQALLPYFLPEQISTYRNEHPGVEFSVLLSFFSSITSFDLVNLKIKFKTFINVCLGSDTKSSYLINR